jgi:hypothetical protein
MVSLSWRRVASFGPPLALLGNVALAAACSSSSAGAGSSTSSGGSPGSDASASSGGGSSGDDGSAASPADAGIQPVTNGTYDAAKTLIGEYAAQIRFRKEESASGLGMEDALITLDASVSIADDASSQTVTMTMRICHGTLSGQGTGLLQGSGLITPDVVFTTTTLDPVPVSAAKENGVVKWSVPEIHGPVGWKWSSPSDTLPMSASDPRIFDQDGDGNPGVTIDVTLSGGMPIPVYVVQAERDTFSGTVDSSGNLAATVVDDTPQYVIGASNPLLASAQLTREAESDTSDNVAQFVRVSSRIDCADLVGEAGALFH